jgi:hypothetical protein
MSEAAIDPERLDLAAEYKARPFGRHSPALQALLDVMYRAENCQNLLLVGIDGGRWVLGERRPGRQPPRLFLEEAYDSPEAGQWGAFRRRWRALTGRELELP